MAGGAERIIILGAGFGGLLTALKIAKISKNANIILIDENERQTYTPRLYELITGMLDDKSNRAEKLLIESSGISVKEAVKPYANIRYKPGRVEDCDFSEKVVQLEGGKTVRYDKLVIALGSTVSYFGIEGLKKNSFVVSSIEHAAEIREALTSCLPQDNCQILIGGAGPTGVETAGELANYLKRHKPERNVDIYLIDAEDRILSRFHSALQLWTTKRLKKLGVNVMTSTKIERVERKSVDITIHGKKKEKLKFDILIWAGGVRPNTTVDSFQLPKDKRGRIRVLPSLQVEGHPDVYAVGDVISFHDQRRDVYAPQTAWAAIGEATTVAKNIARASSRPYKLPKKFPVIISVGGKHAVGSIAGIPLKGRFIFAVRELVDFNYFRKILPFFKAWKFWRKSTRLFSKND